MRIVERFTLFGFVFALLYAALPREASANQICYSIKNSIDSSNYNVCWNDDAGGWVDTVGTDGGGAGTGGANGAPTVTVGGGVNDLPSSVDVVKALKCAIAYGGLQIKYPHYSCG